MRLTIRSTITLIVGVFALTSVPRQVESRDPFKDLTDELFQKECLDGHNEMRARHPGTPSMFLDNELVESAKNRCRIRSATQKKEEITGVGQNLYWGASSLHKVFSCNDAVESWYDEVYDYDWEHPAFNQSTGHFTQLVWKTSDRMGCARCSGESEEDGLEWTETYVICNYKEPGNVVNEGFFEMNVLPHWRMNTMTNMVEKEVGRIMNETKSSVDSEFKENSKS